jgi:hypothetical protein
MLFVFVFTFALIDVCVSQPFMFQARKNCGAINQTFTVFFNDCTNLTAIAGIPTYFVFRSWFISPTPADEFRVFLFLF